MNGESAQQVLDVLESMQSRRQGDKNKEDIAFLVESLTPMLQKFIKRDERRKRLLVDEGDFSPIEDLERIYGTINNYIGRVKQLEKDQEFLNGEYNDLTHALELLEDEDENMLDLARKMKQNRKDRRFVKDTIELANNTYNVLAKYQQFINELSKANRDTKKILEKQQNRTYKVRELTALEEAFAKANKKELIAK